MLRTTNARQVRAVSRSPGRRSTALRSSVDGHRHRVPGPHQCWRCFTHQPSWPAADQVADSTSIGGSTSRRFFSSKWLGPNCIGQLEQTFGCEGRGWAGATSLGERCRRHPRTGQDHRSYTTRAPCCSAKPVRCRCSRLLQRDRHYPGNVFKLALLATRWPPIPGSAGSTTRRSASARCAARRR